MLDPRRLTHGREADASENGISPCGPFPSAGIGRSEQICETVDPRGRGVAVSAVLTSSSMKEVNHGAVPAPALWTAFGRPGAVAGHADALGT